MKKLSCILLAVMLITAMFVSCTAEVIDDSNLVNVRFTTDDNAKGLNWSRPAFDSNDYFWTYSAKKVGGGPSTGEGTGDIGTDLTKEIGPFSQGAWEFTLYGYAKASDGTKTDVLVYEGTGSGVLSKDQDNSVKVAVEARKEGEGTIHISKDIVLKDSKGVTYIPTDIIIKQVGSETASDEIKFNSEEGYSTKKDSGYYAVTIQMVATVNGKEIIYASNTIYVNVYDGQTTTIGGTLDESTTSTKFEAEDGTVSGNEEGEIEADGSATLSVSVAPNTGSTIVEFPEGSFEDEKKGKKATLNVVAYPSSVSKSFSINPSNGAVVSGIDLSLTVDGANVDTFNGKEATVTTYVATGLVSGETEVNGKTAAAEGLKLVYNGSEDSAMQPTIVSYDPTNGKLVFTTTHFSQYYVASTRIVAVNENTNVAFGSLKDAVAAAESGDTITLLCDASGDGIGLYSNPKNGQTKTNDIIIDFNGFTYTINGELQGSTGTVSQAFHLEKDCTVVLKNGKLTSNNAKMLIQNYCNLTLDGMELDFVESGRDYALSNNCGDVHIKDTKIKVANEKIAFDSCKFNTYSIPTVTISGTSEIDGKIELSGGKLVCPSDLKENIRYVEGFKERYNVVDDSGVYTFEDVAKYVKNESDFEKISLTPILSGKNFNDEKANKLNGYYVLENDIEVNHLIYIAQDSTATIDLNGHKITSMFEGFSIGNWGKLTIHDSSEKKSGIVYNACTTFGNENLSHDAIRNFGELVIDGGTFGDQDTNKENDNKVNFGAALNNQKGATAIIKSGNFTTGDNYWKNVEGKNGFSYAIRNFGTLTVDDWHVYGKMNGGVSGDAGTMYLKGGKVEITNPSSWHTLTVESTSGAKIYISGGTYINNNTNSGHLFSAFNGMPSWEVTDLEKNGYFVTGGTFIEDGETKTFTVQQ